MMKRCTKCKIEKEVEKNFWKKKSSPDGYRPWCIDCSKEYKLQNKEKCQKYFQNYYIEHCEQIKEDSKQYRIDNWKEVNNNKKRYHKERRAVDPLYKLIGNLRHRLNIDLTGKNLEKTQSFKEYLGCTPEEAKIYIESQFTPEMNWSNYGKYFEIDHIVPLCSAQTEEEIYKLCHYTNLRPLSKKAHYTKSVLDKATYPKD